MPRLMALTAGLLVAWSASLVPAQEWKPAAGPLMTRWAKEVSPENVLPEYPRPQMVREKWQNLNGLWDFVVAPVDEAKADSMTEEQLTDRKILVPFPIESALSGVMERVGDENQLWYHRKFTIPGDWKGQRVLLHFGAVDWRATVFVNKKKVGSHEGGYDRFTFDITDALTGDAEQDLVVSVWDPTEKGTQPRGKQISNPHGIWYTPVTGIWQTVWLEPVPEAHISSIRVQPNFDGESVSVTTAAANGKGLTVRVSVPHVEIDGRQRRIRASEGPAEGAADDPADNAAGEPVTVKLLGQQPWTPEKPYLYGLKVELLRNGQAIDSVTSYFGQRKIGLAKDEQGINRLYLNGKPVFQFGPLDQGWWPDGLYTAPTDEALKYDIEVTKRLGFNMVRKHVKVEPARWYYHCDKLGLLVWQDMPNGDHHIGPNDPDITRTPESEAIYRKEWKAIIDALRNHPSIVCWVPFNEGWGQFKTNEILAWTKELDPTRLVDGPSGWTDRNEGDMHDMHNYPSPGMFPVESERASVLGEYGGLGLPVEGHLWKQQDNWGYRSYKNQEDLIRAYTNLTRALPPLIGKGLAAAVYTQTTDVEVEVNGLMTYDRAVIKLPPEWVAEINKTVHAPPPREVMLAPTSEDRPRTWRYTTQDPGEGWQQATFDDSSWKQGEAGFGTEGTPGAKVRTSWDGSEIWLRAAVALPAKAHALALRIHHDEDATVYLNGKQIASVPGYTTEYTLVPLDEGATRAAKKGENLLAVHCKQTGGGQYIDVGLVDLVPAEKSSEE